MLKAIGVGVVVAAELSVVVGFLIWFIVFFINTHPDTFFLWFGIAGFIGLVICFSIVAYNNLQSREGV